MTELSEQCFTGYCRRQDQSRMVFCEYDPAGRLLHADCAYPDCAYAAACPIAAAFNSEARQSDAP